MTNMLCTRAALNTPSGHLPSSHEFPKEDDDILVTTNKFQNISTQNSISNCFFCSKICFVPENSFQTPLLNNHPSKGHMSFVETFQGGHESLLNLLREVRGFVEPAKGVFQKVQEPLL